MEVKEQLIMVQKYDLKRETAYFTHVTLEDLAKNPNDVNLELLGLHFLNVIRHGQGLEPMVHDPRPDHIPYYTGDGQLKLNTAEQRIVELEDMLGKVREGKLCSDCKGMTEWNRK